MKRFNAAHICISGACNPRRIAMALVEAIDEARSEGIDDVRLKEDAAVILILDQLSQVLGAYTDSTSSLLRFSRAYDTLQERQNFVNSITPTTNA